MMIISQDYFLECLRASVGYVVIINKWSGPICIPEQDHIFFRLCLSPPHHLRFPTEKNIKDGFIFKFEIDF